MDIRPIAVVMSLFTTVLYAADQETQSLNTEITNDHIAAPVSCVASSNELDTVKAKYEGIMNAERQQIEQEVNAIKSEAPDPNQAEAAIGMTFHFRDEQMEVKLDLPTVTMVDQKMSMDLPETTMKTQTWSWDVPETTMKTQCTPGIPETVIGTGTCEAFGVKYSCPTITVRAGKDICADVPEIKMVRHEAKLDVPEFTMNRKEWVMGVPETKMETQRIVFNYPALVVTNIEVKSKDLQKRGEALGKRSQDTFKGISEAMKSEVTLASMRNIDKSFACQKKQLSVQIRKAYNDLNAMQEASKASVDRAKTLNASPEIINSLTTSTAKLTEAKKSLLDQYVKARRDIESKRKEVLVKLNDAVGGKKVEEVAALGN